MWSDYDRTFRQRAVRAARADASARVLIVLSGGPHHFSQFDDHSHALHFAVHDSFDYPCAAYGMALDLSLEHSFTPAPVACILARAFCC